MELKRSSELDLLVVLAGFNRTFMELKHNSQYYALKSQGALIGPLWN